MSLADDQATPATPFYGDETGKIFDTPDLVLESPATTERVVDTQSGFLVVVRRLGSRSALSVKRRLGTPPVSSILLTPDESLQLSRILIGSQATADALIKGKATAISANLNEWNSRFASNAIEKTDGLAENKSANAEKNIDQLYPRQPVLEKYGQAKSNLAKGNGHRAIVFSFVVVVALASGILLANHWRARQAKKTVHAQAKVVIDVPSDEDIDKFVRTYVADMLDFSAESYKLSQIQAMSMMTPQLMAKYWQETNFPIPERQLKNGLKHQTLLITKLVQQPSVDKSAKVIDVFAQLNGIDGKPSVPTHLQLKLALSGSRSETIRVAEQNDLSASDK